MSPLGDTLQALQGVASAVTVGPAAKLPLVTSRAVLPSSRKAGGMLAFVEHQKLQPPPLGLSSYLLQGNDIFKVDEFREAAGQTLTFFALPKAAIVTTGASRIPQRGPDFTDFQ